MKFIVIIAALFAAASAINPTALYRSRCGEGESYWCESPTQAKECDAVDYCIEMRWKGKPIQGVVCDSCLAFVNGVHNVLESTTVQSEIISGAKLACVVMGPLKLGCELLVDMYGPELLKKLVTELTGQEVCDLMGLCTKKATGPLQKVPVAVNEVESPKDDEICDMCKEFFGEIESIISNTTIQQTVENDILELCPLIEAFVPNCTTIVKTYFPLIVAFLMENLNPDMVCKEIGLCPGMGGLKELLQKFKDLKNRVGDLCMDCKTAFLDLDDMLTNPTIQQAVILELDQLCSNLGAYATGCKTLVNTYTTTVMDSIAAALAPDTVCTEIHFCQSTLPVSQKVSLARVLLGGDICTDCKAFVGDIDAMLQNTTEQQMIIKQLDTLCDSLGPLATECKTLVNQYAPLIFEFLPTILTPDTVCTDVGFCSSEKQLVQEMALSGDMCTDCKAFVDDIDNMLKNETVQKMIITDLDNLCASLGSFATQCKTYVDQYGALVLDLLPTILTSDTVCTNIGMCSSGQVAVKKPEINMNFCTVCQEAVTALDGIISSSATQALIIKGLDVACTHLGLFAPVCKALVKQYTPQIINLIVTHMVPNTVCTDIGLCPGASNAAKFLQKVHADPKTCADCKAFFLDVDAMVANLTFQKEVIAELEMLCRDAGQYAAECKLLVDTYTGTVLDYIVQFLDPTTICTDLDVCASTDSVPRKLRFSADFCSDCKTFVTDIDSLLGDQTVQGDIISALEGVCDKFPSVAAECKMLIETYGKTLINDLVTALNPTTVCTDLHICQSSEPVVKSTSLQSAVSVQYTAMTLSKAQPVTTLQEAKPVPTTKADDPSPDCLLCETIVGYMLDLLNNNKTEEEILDAVAEVCDLLPASAQQTCKNDIHTYGYLIIMLLKTEGFTPEQVCSTIGLCTSAAPSPKLKNLKDIKLFMSAAMPRADEFCSICKLFVTELDSILSSNKSKDEIVAEVEKLLCDNLPSPINDQCNAFMQIYGDVLVQLLIEQFNPDTFCVDVGLCTSMKKQPVKATPPVNSPAECALCEFVMSELDSLIGKNSTEAEIKAALDKVCSLLPSTLEAECDAFINQYADMILKLLMDDLSPQQVCTALGLCSSVEKLVEKTPPVGISEQCILCEYIVHELDDILEENSTEAEIEAALDKVCSLLPATLNASCNQFIATYFPLLVSFLEQDLPPEKLCTALGFCQSKVKAVKASVECTICEFVMSELDSILSENATQAEIEAALEKVCSILPATVKEECDDFITTYTPILIELLQSQSPDAICTLLGLCQAQLQLKAKVGGLDCDLCQTTVRTIDDAIQEPEVTAAIVAIVNDTCAILPETIKATCYSYVTMYGNLVTQFIAQYFDPITTCTLLDICPRPDNSPRKQLLGQHVCNQGPAYWCASQENALQCNMVEHCMRHVWN